MISGIFGFGLLSTLFYCLLTTLFIVFFDLGVRAFWAELSKKVFFFFKVSDRTQKHFTDKRKVLFQFFLGVVFSVFGFF